MSHFSITLTKDDDRLFVGCRSWREVRHVIRQWAPVGYTATRIYRNKWRENWLGDRTFARHALRDLEETK